MEKIDTVVVGGGQAGIAMSEHLGNLGIDHVVLERDRIAERWRTGRWDSLVANGPAWHDRFPGREFDCSADAFPGKEDVAAYFEAYAHAIGAPVRTGVAVEKVVKEGRGFQIATSQGKILAQNVVAATGPFQKPVIPPVIPETAGVHQLHSQQYRNPQQLADGSVLVVGAGSSGAQIAEELLQDGRDVYLSIGPHDRPPRSYRGRDYCWWLGVLGKWNADTPRPGTEHVTISVSGADGGKTVDFRKLAERGMTLLGMTDRFENGVLHFADDLRRNLTAGDENYLNLLREADVFASENNLDLPEEMDAHNIPADPPCVSDPIQSLDLGATGLSTVLWATGYALDYSWLDVDTFDAKGQPLHSRGVSRVPGVYFVGLPWLTRRGSSFIWGVWHDAKFIADQIAIHHGYMNYHAAAAAHA